MTDDKFAQAKSIDILNTRGLSAKRDYVRGLERRGDAEALSLLVECLCDESWFLRDLAEEAFLNMAERGAETVWHGEAYQAFRDQLSSETPPDVCRSCSVYSGTF